MIGRLRGHLIQLLHLRETAHRTALAFSIGVVIAFSPTYGLHTASVFLFSWAFRLNFVALMAGALINNPWTFVPIIGLTFWTGLKVLNLEPVAFHWDDLSTSSFYQHIMPYLAPFVVGGLLLSLVAGIVSYPVAYFLISRFRARHPTQSIERERLPPSTPVG